MSPADGARIAVRRPFPGYPHAKDCMTPPRYFLTRSTYLARTAHHWVFLDLQRDNYLAVHERDFASFGPALHGCTETSLRHGSPVGRAAPAAPVAPAAPAAPNAPDAPESPASELLKQLLDAGLMTTSPAHGKPMEGPRIPPADATLYGIGSHATGARHYLHLFSFLKAARRANRMLEQWPIERIVARIAARKKSYFESDSAVTFDVERAGRHVAVFNCLRPLYPRDYLCLFDSLALLEFLAPRSLFPEWVFGVVTDPFMAHCWVQSGSTLVNETVERALVYVPILAV